MVSIGIDLGGTNIAAGVVNDDGQIEARLCVATRPERSYSEILSSMADCVHQLMDNHRISCDQIRGVGIGIPGIVIEPLGLVAQCTNLRWFNRPIRTDMKSFIPFPVRISNDANLAALAESCSGAAAGCRSCALLTLGTGVGGGIVINGRPWSGALGQAGEFGHTVLVADGIPCACGRSGCVEQYCSATALASKARHLCTAFPESAILAAANGNPDSISAEMVINAARNGDPQAMRLFRQYAHYLALTIDNIINTVNPEVVLIGGGVSQAGSFLLDAVRAEIPSHTCGFSRPLPRVELAKLRNDAGIIGAAMLFREDL
ncbi:MAG: ROK family protein [Clostridia bacterium]|nr:ROK family protein [Clostridia bacterium]